MKSNFLLITLMLFSFCAMAQAPDGISYQTIFRDGNGQPYVNTQLTVKMIIHAGNTGGEIVYSEIHQATSNVFGLVNLTVGLGEPITGNFEDINWGDNSYFLETALDITGSGQFQVMGTSQFLSVPYSKFSDNSGFTTLTNGIRVMTLAERDALENPVAGMTILNITTNCLNFYNGVAWFETCGDCQPLPDEANAGPDQSGIIGTTATLQGNTPENGNGLWAIVSGTGGSFADNTNPNTLFTGNVGESYNLSWTISTGCGSNSDEVNISFAAQGWACGQDFTDPRDGQVYPSVLIGDQCWMAKNMNIGTMVTTTPTNNGIIEKFCYNELESNCDVYGGLYPWDEAMEYTTNPGAQGICPPGWHIPTDAQWCTLTTYLDNTVDCSATGWTGTDAGGKLKEAGTSHWITNNPAATNSSGFTALPGGFSYSNGSYQVLGYYGAWWFSTESNVNLNARLILLRGSTNDVELQSSGKTFSYSVRCMADETTTSQLNVTPENQDVTNNAGTTTFEVTSNESWTVTENETWLSVAPANGNNNGTITVTFEANPDLEPRVGQITVTAEGGNPVVTVTVTQEAAQPFACGQDFTDPRDGQVYPTVQIGDQCWMAKNMNIGTRINDPEIPANNGIIEKYCYNNQESNCDIYGALYLWDEMMQYSNTTGVQGICPTGWHLPQILDFQILIQSGSGFSNPETGGALKTTGTIEQGTGLWYEPNTGATNETGFSALPAGMMFLSKDNSPELEQLLQNPNPKNSGSPESSGWLGNCANFWTSTPSNYSLWLFAWNTQAVISNQANPNDIRAVSVRCIAGDPITPQLDVTPENQQVLHNAGTTTFEVTSNLDWISTENETWLSVAPANGNNNGTITVTFEANPDLEPRVGQITVTAEGGNPVVTVTVTQEAAQPFACGQDFTDPRDGQVYPTVQIGNQCWMAKNMNIGTMVTTTPTNNGTIEKFCNDDLTSNCDVYGGLYPWGEMMNYTTIEGAQGICPTGWHIPTDAQWCALTTYLDATVDCQATGYTGTDAGGKMKETGTSHWLFPNTGATNSSGFTALPGGITWSNGTFAPPGAGGFWWLSTQDNAQNAWLFNLHAGRADVGHNLSGKIFGYSVRCMADETTTSQLIVTPENQDVTHNAGATTFEVTSNLDWTATENETWLTLTPANGSNNGIITVNYLANFGLHPQLVKLR